MKKIIAFLLALTVMLSLAACGGEAPAADVPENAEPAPTAAKVEPVDEEEETEAPVAVEQPDFPETIIVDDENCTVKVTAIEVDNIWGYTLKVYLENKTELNLMFSWDHVSVNGYMCDPFWATTVNAGMKANEEISFAVEDFEEIGISNVTDITFNLRVYDNDDWMADALVDDVYAIYPMGEEAVQAYPREPQESDVVLFDNDECAMIVTGYDPDNLWGYTVKVFLVNKTDDVLMFSVNDASVNGYMCDPFWAEEIAAGKMGYAEISWMESDFEANGITEVESLTLPIRVYDSEDWSADDLVNETFELTP